MEKSNRISNLTSPNVGGGGSSGNLIGNSVRVNNRTPSKVGSERNSQQTIGKNAGGGLSSNYSAICLDRQQYRPSMINKTAEQSTRKNSKIMIEETTQKMDIKDMLLQIKPSASIEPNNFFKV